MRNLAYASTTKVLSAGAAAAATDLVLPAIDTLGYSAIEIIVVYGAFAAGGACKLELEFSNDNGVTDPYVPVAGSAGGITVVPANANEGQVLDVNRPMRRWVQPVITRSLGTGTIAISSVVAILYQTRDMPTASDVSLVGTTVISEALAGTP